VIRPIIEHVDLVVVRKGEKVTVDVPVHVVGTAAVETVVTVENNTVELSVEGAAAGTRIHASDLVLPEGAELITDPEILIVNITQAISEEALEAELAGEVTAETAEAPAAGDAAEGETPAAEADKA